MYNGKRFSSGYQTSNKCINDIIVEPARKSLIPGYEKLKLNAIRSGALAVTISGAGPSMIAFTNSAKKAHKIKINGTGIR